MLAIILVGGQGTRLRSVISDLPKPMAPIQDKPFLAYLLDYLKKQNFTDIIFPVHYMSEKIESYFQTEYAGMNIQYIHEAQPLGTGGAIANALADFDTMNKPIFVLNGDTFVKLNYQAMYAQHVKEQSQLTLALRSVDDSSRYGRVIIDHDRIVEFQEKGRDGSGLINAGVYLMDPNLFATFNLPHQFSFEEFIHTHLLELAPHAFIASDYFIDIGIPEDYARAIHDLPLL